MTGRTRTFAHYLKNSTAMHRTVTPTGPYSFITNRLAIGGVATGAFIAGLEPFDTVLNVAYEWVEVIKQKHSLAHHIGFDDTRNIEPELPKIERAVEFVRARRKEGQTVLVTCSQGRNRSGVVVAETLIREGYHSAQSVIDTIRERRANALTNPAFVAWLLRPRDRAR